MDPKTKNRLDGLKKLREKMEQQLETLSRQELEIVIDEDLRKDGRFKALQKQQAQIKARLHLVRVNIARKQHSERIRDQSLRKLRQAIADFKREETERVQEMSGVEQEIERLREELINKAEKAG